MSKEVLTLGDIKRNKILAVLRDVNIEKVLLSNKISFVEKNYKYFFVYLHNDSRVKPLHKMLPKNKHLCTKL